ncbi:MAG: hypothetical protein J1E43_01240 [Christensenellaceae bacterium]|nr:hypothetical protein [Christensenellaceae bacterium]
MIQELLTIHERVVRRMQSQPEVLGAWYFGSASRQQTDEHSDLDVVFLIAGERFADVAANVTSWLETCCDRVVLCWPEGFNGDSIVNNGYLLELGGKLVVYDVFLLNSERLDDGICRVHYADLQRENIIFDRNGSVAALAANAPSNSLWQDDAQRLIDTYWYHAHLSAKYLVRRDFFKLEAVLRTMMDAHASLLLTALDRLPWGGSANKLNHLPASYQQHLKRYGCTEDFSLMRESILQSMRWFDSDAQALAEGAAASHEQSISTAILPRWMAATASLSST